MLSGQRAQLLQQLLRGCGGRLVASEALLSAGAAGEGCGLGRGAVAAVDASAGAAGSSRRALGSLAGTDPLPLAPPVSAADAAASRSCGAASTSGRSDAGALRPSRGLLISGDRGVHASLAHVPVPSAGPPPHQHQQLRGRHAYNFAQPVDTRQINDALGAASLLEHAALPIAQWGRYFDPAQTTATLRRLPMMAWEQQGRVYKDVKGAVREQHAALLQGLMTALGGRLAEVAADCDDRQLAAGLWAFPAARTTMPPTLVEAVCQQLAARMAAPGGMELRHLATAAWALAQSCGPEQRASCLAPLLAALGDHLAALPRPGQAGALYPVNTPPPPPPPTTSSPADGSATPGRPSSSSSSLSPPAGADRRGDNDRASSASRAAAVAAAAAGAGAGFGGHPPRPYADHRSVVKLAAALAAGGVAHAPALDWLAAHASAQLADQLAAHEAAQSARAAGPGAGAGAGPGAAAPGAPGGSGGGRLVPRATYRYRSVRGWLDLAQPLPPRPSKYLRASEARPRVLLADYSPPSLAALLTSYASLGHAPPPPLMDLIARHAQASAPRHVAPAVALRLLGAAAKLSPRGALSPALAGPLLAATPLAPLSARQLLGLAAAASRAGLASSNNGAGASGGGELLFRRLLRAAVARLEIEPGLGGPPLPEGTAPGDVVSGGEAAALLGLCGRAGVGDSASLSLLASRLGAAPGLPPGAAASAALAASRAFQGLQRRLERLAAAAAAAGDADGDAAARVARAQAALDSQLRACRPLLLRAADAVAAAAALSKPLAFGVAGRVAVALLGWPGKRDAAGGGGGRDVPPAVLDSVVGALRPELLSPAQGAAIARAYALRGRALPPALASLSLLPPGATEA